MTPGLLRNGRVCLETPTPRVAPGQVVARYDGDGVVGGGLAAATVVSRRTRGRRRSASALMTRVVVLLETRHPDLLTLRDRRT